MRLSKMELVELVENIIRAEGTEEEIDEMINLLEKNVPHPEVSDLIFWNEKELTPVEIVEEALNYIAIILPPPI